MAMREQNAADSFVTVLVEQHGFTKSEAKEILDEYLRVRVMKLGMSDGQFHVKHGAFMDKDVLQRALVQARGRGR